VIFDQNVVSHLELLKAAIHRLQPRGLLLSRDKSLSKKLLAYHRINVPEFDVFRIGRPIRRPKRLQFPLIVKSLTQEASIGISQASVWTTTRSSGARHVHPREHRHGGDRRAVHRSRELYVGILATRRPGAAGVGAVLHQHAGRGEADRDRPREVERQVPGEVRIDSGAARELTDEQCAKIQHVCKRAYRALELSGYARVDLRLDEAGPCGSSRRIRIPRLRRARTSPRPPRRSGSATTAVLQRIVNLGLRWQPESVA